MDIVKEIAADIIAASGMEVFVNSKRYVIKPPTIERLCGAFHHLSDMDIRDLDSFVKYAPRLGEMCKALSWFIKGDESLYKDLMKGRPKEVTEGLVTALSMIDVENFMMLSALARNGRKLIALTR